MQKFNLKLIREKTQSIKWLNYLLLFIPFAIMDLFIRMLSRDVSYSMTLIILPSILFSVMWVGLIVTIVTCLKGKIGVILYSVCFAAFYVFFVANVVCFSYTDFFFTFNMMSSADEGSAYFKEVLGSVDVLTWIIIGLTLLIAVFAAFVFPIGKKFRWKPIVIAFLVFILLHTLTPMLLGKANSSLEWDTWRNPRNVYQNFGDCNKNVKICGLYEYVIRDCYVTYFKPQEKPNPEEIEFLESSYAETTPHTENQYTGILEGKNLIFLQLEGIDDWLLTPEVMPNLYGMLSNSMVFDDHYSYYSGGGSTFNSELAVTTGFITPISFQKNPYSFNNSNFPYSLPRCLKDNGYTVNAFHMNSGEYYVRELNYKNWGYDNYYGLMDETEYTDYSYQLDRELILNEGFYEKQFKSQQPFMNYVITYTVHTPFTLESPQGKLLAQELYGVTEGESAEITEYPEISEEEAVKLFAGETDKMVGMMLEALKDNGLYENTAIVVFSDHYLYTINDKSILERNKEHFDNNLINHTPFFIWSCDFEETHIEKTNSQIDITPTVLNMLGISYMDEHYIGRDVMDESYGGYVFFNDRSWYDGTHYVELGEVTNITEYDELYINDTNAMINDLMSQNDLTLKYDYFDVLNKK